MLWSGLLASEPISHSGQPCSVTGPRNNGIALPGDREFQRSSSHRRPRTDNRRARLRFPGSEVPLVDLPICNPTVSRSAPTKTSPSESDDVSLGASHPGS